MFKNTSLVRVAFGAVSGDARKSNGTLEIPFAPFTNGTTAELTAQMLKLNKEHTIYDPEFRPPTFRREDPSIFTPTTAILVTVTLKRKGNKKIEGENSKANKESKELQEYGHSGDNLEANGQRTGELGGN
ncbi:hypothetical protein B0H14DRAFT_2640388 [Mycena olivaceomarginata]|nr:hypothetical protein B0H14DRAFT_2640388 [Mycena olivaceomarginata]